MSDSGPDMLKPTLLAGVLFGIVSAMPVLGLLNCACCSLVVGCGFFAAFLYSSACRRQGAAFGPATGATTGLIAGAFHAITVIAITAVIGAITGFGIEAVFTKMEEGGVEPDQIETIRAVFERLGTVGLLVIGFFLWVLVGAVFSTIGGALGGLAFRFVPAPPPPPSYEPPPPPVEGPPPPPSEPPRGW